MSLKRECTNIIAGTLSFFRLKMGAAENATELDVKKTSYKNLIVVSLGFLFTFTAFQALQNLASSIHQIEHVGLASLCVIYASLVLSCMFIPTLMIEKLGAKYTIMASMGGYVLYTLANFYPRWWTLILASAVLGLHLYFNLFCILRVV